MMTPLAKSGWSYAVSALTGKWSGYSDWIIPGYMEWFYRIKAFICLLLYREPEYNRLHDPIFEYGVHVTYTDGGSYTSPGEPTVHWFEVIVVGYGIRRNWWATIHQDSTDPPRPPAGGSGVWDMRLIAE